MRLAAPLRERDFRLLWTGMAVSLLGDGIFLVAVAWQAYRIDDRPSSLAWVGLSTSLPQIALLLVAGAVTDRVPRRSVLFLADASRGAAVAALAALSASGEATIPLLCAVGALLGVGTAFSSPALDAIVPQLLADEHLVEANVIDQFVRPAAIQLAGPALGGLAVAALGTSGAFFLDSGSFFFSALCVSRMSRLAPPGAGHASLRREMAAGLAYVRRHVFLWGTFLSATFTYLLFIGPTQVLIPYVVRNTLHDGAEVYGVVLAVGGVGALAGALAAGRRRSPRRPMVFIYACWTLATLAVAAYGIASDAVGLAAAALVVNGAEAAGTVVWATLKQRKVENSMLGRVSSIDWCVSTALLPASYALTAPIAHLLGARTTLVVAGTAGAVVTASFLFLPGMRTTGVEVDRAGEARPVGAAA